jgi:REP element-mobilizing transposase RayT
MLNHVHLLIQAPDVAGFVRDFKKHTSLELMKNMEKTEPAVADLFKDKHGKFSVWKKTNMPQLIQTDKFFGQKKNYIENNPVRKRYVDIPEHWFFSSAHKQDKLAISEIEDV